MIPEKIMVNSIFPAFAFLIVFAALQLKAKNIYINEFLASNVTTNAEILDFDDYSDWIEIYNDENQAIDLGGYYLTDNLTNPQKLRIQSGTIIQAKGYLLFWADGMPNDEIYGSNANHHLNFKLSKGGEEIGLFDPQLALIDSIVYGPQITDVSFGRKADSISVWNYFGEPTPGQVNNTPATLNREKASDPIFSKQGGLYNTHVKIVLSAASPGAQIRYTTDGSRPSSNSKLYTSVITLESTTVIRARVFDGDLLPGAIKTHSYFINENQSLPVVSISAFPETMFDRQIGIYTNGIKGKEIPVSFEYFKTNGELGFALDAGLRISGQAAYVYEQKPMTIAAKSRFGAESIEYKIFPARDIENFKSIYLRNSGTPDVTYTMFRDALQHSLVINQFDLDCQAYQPANTFINGSYWGLYNIREKLDADYLASHHDIDPTNIDYLEYDFDQVPVVIEGDLNDFNELQVFLNDNNLNITENYNYVRSQIDINEYLNYMITQIFCDNQNYLYTNVRWWREKVKNSKWRWVMLDLDFGFGIFNDYTHNGIIYATYENSEWSTFLFRKLLESPQFRNAFIQRFAIYLNTVFHRDRVVHIFDSLKTNISGSISRHIDRWGLIPSLRDWNNNVRIMRDFASNRQAQQWQHINDFFGLHGTTQFSVHMSDSTAGEVKLNNVVVPENYSGLHFKDVPITLQAIPAVGFRFKGWKGVSNSIQDSISVSISGPTSITAIFEPSDDSVLPSLISTDTTLTMAGSPYLVKGDLLVSEDAVLTLEQGVEIQMTENSDIIVYGNIIVNGSSEFPVIIQPNKTSGSSQWGVLCIENSTAPAIISNFVIRDATKGNDAEKHIGAISVHNSEITMDRIRIEDSLFPIYAQYSKVTLTNSFLHSKHTSDLINVKYADSTLIENCDFRGNLSYDTDAIDLDQVNNGIVRANRIYNFFGSNSDGIDLGEGSKNIRIEQNLIFNCKDKGISVGQGSTTKIEKNIIVNCAQGVGIKDDFSFADIVNNTFYGNDYAVASFEKNLAAGGGNARVTNCILSNSNISPYMVDNLSVLNISYSLSDTKDLPGQSNLSSNPGFSNNFYLNPNSPAINTGDPASPTDPDDSVADMGATYYDGSEHEKIMITEIHFNPADGDDYEFIELYNSGSAAINISGYKLSGALNFTFPEESYIASGEYLVIAKNAQTYINQGFQVFEWIGNPLPDEAADIQLFSESNEALDFVSYDTYDHWQRSPNGAGPSLELRSLNFENLLNRNWRVSYIDGGTPGQKNSSQIVEDLYINEIMADNDSGIRDNNDEYEDWIEIYNGSARSIDLGGMFLTDDFNTPALSRIPISDPEKTTIKPGEYMIFWADRDTDQGIFHLNFRLNNEEEEIGLVHFVDNDTIFIDQIRYKDQQADMSYGRKPDGGENFFNISLPTPGLPNTIEGAFEKGILVVNRLRQINSGEVYDAYANKAFWGKYSISFWDGFTRPEKGYPSTLSNNLVGNGYVPFNTLVQYSTVIWLGSDVFNNQSGLYNSTDFLKYVEYGGNLLLFTNKGRTELGNELSQLLGITWVEDNIVTTNNCISAYDGLTDLALISSQYFNAVFNTDLANERSTLLYQETASFDMARGLGVWHNPELGGLYNPNGGQFVFISGRPYRYDHQDMRTNMEYILENFLGEKVTNLENSFVSDVVDHYELAQNYPNPFNPATKIKYALKKAGLVTLEIYDMLGRKIITLIEKKQDAGRYEVLFDAKNYATGIYFIRLKSGNFIKTRKMLFLK